VDLRPCDLQLVRPLQVRLHGKGRKERLCPLWPQTAAVLRALLADQRIAPTAAEPLFRNRRGQALTRFGVRYLLRKYACLASTRNAGRRQLFLRGPQALTWSFADSHIIGNPWRCRLVMTTRWCMRARAAKPPPPAVAMPRQANHTTGL
jgi:integrase